MPHENLPRVTYSNIGVDFTPLHDMLDIAIPAFKRTLGRSWPNMIGGRPDDDGRRYKAQSPIDDRIMLGEFVAASAPTVARAVEAAKAAFPAWSRLRWQERGGPPVTAPHETGFGTELIRRAFGFELDGTADLAF